MLYGYELGAVVDLLLFVYAFLDVLRTPAEQCRELPKVLWLFLCFVPVIGPIAWLVLGRPQGPARSLPYKGNTGIPPEYDRPGRATAANPDDDAVFLAELKERAEQQRKKAVEQAKRLREREDEPPPPP